MQQAAAGNRRGGTGHLHAQHVGKGRRISPGQKPLGTRAPCLAGAGLPGGSEPRGLPLLRVGFQGRASPQGPGHAARCRAGWKHPASSPQVFLLAALPDLKLPSCDFPCRVPAPAGKAMPGAKPEGTELPRGDLPLFPPRALLVFSIQLLQFAQRALCKHPPSSGDILDFSTPKIAGTELPMRAERSISLPNQGPSLCHAIIFYHSS